MRGTTHLVVGLLVALLILLFFPAESALLVIPLVLFGALLPDVDHEGSRINKLIPITRWIPWFFSHRGFFHSLFPPLAVIIVAVAFGAPVLGVYVVVGYITHLLTDMLTQAGVGLLHPVIRQRIHGPLHTGGVAEALLFIVVLAVDALLVVRLL
jgi:inner membrane protein